VLDHNGNLIATLTNNLLDSPWDLTIQDGFNWARVFVSNVRSGTVTRLDLDVYPGGILVKQVTQIAGGYKSHSDPAALIVGPTGLAYDANADVLYVASTADNEIFAVPHAGTANHSNGPGTVIYQDNAHLRGPLALAFAPNGDLLTSNGDAPTVSPPSTQTLNSEIVEFTKNGQFIAEFSIDSAAGGAFGIATAPVREDSTHLAAVDDATNELTVFRLSTP
jgi:DNA-binding beta-propeller fold protein YncE